MHTRTLDRPQLGQEFTLQWVVIRRGPLSMFLQWLSNAHFKIQTSTTYLTGDGGAGQGHRRLWHAFREAESPGPPDGPGEYWFYCLFVWILVGGCFWMKIYEFSGWHDAFWDQWWWFVDEIDIQVKFLYSDINNTYNILSLRFDLVFPHYITYSTQIIRTLALVRRIQNLQWST